MLPSNPRYNTPHETQHLCRRRRPGHFPTGAPSPGSVTVSLYECIATGNAVSIADAERQRPALFILDIMVPGKDGLGTLPSDPPGIPALAAGARNLPDR